MPILLTTLRALVALTWLGWATPTMAHAVLVESRPAAGASVPAGHAELWLRFNSRIDAARSRVWLSRDGADTPLTQRQSGRADVVVCPAELSPGAYVLRWQVLAVDGHITRGSVPFTATAGTGG